jgi:ABC-type glycerol-3-phosphate transport system substrate-binding protein
MSKGWKLLVIIGGIILVYLLIVLLRFDKTPLQAKVELTFWHVYDKTDDIQPLLDQFQAANPGVKVSYRSFTNLPEYRETLISELAAGQGPDVFAVNNSWIPKYTKILQPLPSELGLTPALVRDTFVPTVGEDVILTEETTDKNVPKDVLKKESVLALPMYVDSLALFYNEKIFRNVLSRPSTRPQTIWFRDDDSGATAAREGVREDAIKVSIPDDEDPSGEGFRLSGIALGRADNISRGVDLFYLLYLQMGGRDFFNDNGELAVAMEHVNDPLGRNYNPAILALDFLTRFTRNHRYAEYSWSAAMGQDALERELDPFVRGKVAMVVGYSYYYEQIQNLIKQYAGKRTPTMLRLEDVKIAPIPQVFDPELGYPKVALADYFALAVSRNSAHPKEAWQLILYLTSHDVLRQYHAATNRPTSRRDLVSEQAADSLFGVFAEQAVYATSLFMPDDEKYDLAVGLMLDRVADGLDTPETGLQKMATNLKCFLDGRSDCLLGQN